LRPWRLHAGACPETVDGLDEAMRERRSMEEALADLRAKYEKHPSATLARMIQHLEAEIAIRKRPPER
jgi:hypothetical protein